MINKSDVGRSVCLRNGKTGNILYYDPKKMYPVCVEFLDGPHLTYTEKGELFEGCTNESDIVIVYNHDPDHPFQATKYDLRDGKPKPQLLPTGPLEDIARVMAAGEVKYGAWNWTKGMEWSRPYGACLRHLFAWARGETTDPETGFNHLAHAACNLLFLLEYSRTGTGEDDRAVD